MQFKTDETGSVKDLNSLTDEEVDGCRENILL